MKKNKILFNIFKALLSIILIYFLFKNIKVKVIFQQLKNTDIFYFVVGSILFVIFQQLFTILRWRVILHFNKINISIWKIIKYHYISILFQMFLPSGFGADATKAILTLKYGKKSGAINSVFIARVIGVIVLLLFALFSSFFIKDNRVQYLQVSIIALILLLIIFFILIRNDRFYSLISSLKFVKRFKKIEYLLINFRYNMDIKLLTILFFYSIFIQFSVMLTFYFIVKSIHIYIGFGKILMFVPVITILAMVIPSINGIGAREYLIFYFFKKEIGSIDVLGSLAVISYSIFFMSAFIGLLFGVYNILFNKE